ncbi:alpha-mannosidase [Paenibacillus sp. FSL L8-0708]|uniref:alpha-mannosidase n=1 Tax=Paenibacillus sp. FSL L8-0708 TaxID=2975311 RepID=UPI0030F65DC2
MTKGKTNAVRQTAHIIPHTHWDREWYLPYEKHHVLLIGLMDTLLDALEQDPDYRSFHLDGQTIILEDYLQVRPEKQELLKRFIQEGRISIGPWYILQDAFLTSGEANLRNLQIGHRDAAQYGRIAKVGYFPDTFGNIGQAPQILRQAGIDNAVFGRGVKPTGFNNTVSDAGYESSFSELIWEGPDGSQVLGILFANWYSNGMEIPVDEAEAVSYWKHKLADAGKYASTTQLLFMNGCDHQPVQTDLSEALAMARELYPETEFVHSSFGEYLDSLREAQPEGLSVVKGELRSQRTDGWSTLVNTASARIYLKQLNQRGQSLLSGVAEPLAAIAHTIGEAYPHHLFTYAWKTLMQNHPHDSICGCSVDEVHREMITRFAKSRDVAEALIGGSQTAIAGKVNTSGLSRYGNDALPFVVFNTTGWKRSGTVTIELEAAKIYFREGLAGSEMIKRMKAADITGRVLVNSEDQILSCRMEDLGLQFGYDLPDDKFRQPYWSRRVRLTFEAVDVPALGLRTYGWVHAGGRVPEEEHSLLRSDRVLDNGRLRLEVADDGSFTVTDLTSGHAYRDLGVYEDTGDIGNEYMYKQPDGEEAITTRGIAAEITIAENTPYRAALQIIHRLNIPAGSEERFEEEKREAVYYAERKSQRRAETVPLMITTTVSLERSAAGIRLRVELDNQATDHRIRALFPTDLQAAVHRADSIFEVAVRDNEPAAEWVNPSNTQHQQAFVDVSDGVQGLTVANLGLHEYEVLRDGRNTIAVTLLRSVSELGDWGIFPTPEAQCLGRHTAELLLMTHAGEGALEAYPAAYQFQVPWTAIQTGLHEGPLVPDYRLLAWEGEGIAFSSAKIGEESGDLTLRWFNMQPEAAHLQLRMEGSFYESDVLERRGKEFSHTTQDDGITLTVGSCEIVTVGVRRGNLKTDS